MGGVEPLGIPPGRSNSVSQVDGISDMAAAFWLCGFAVGEFRKGTMASAHLDSRHFGFFLPFKLLPWCWSSEGVSLSR